MQADHIWHNGSILTMDPATPHAQALAVRGGRLLAVGADKDVLNLQGPHTKLHDLYGQFVMPGLVESHTHALWGACRTLYDIYVGFAASLDQLLEATRDRCKQNSPDQIVYGGPWRPVMREEMGANPRALLDAISTDHMIVLHDASQHILWCNSRALQMAGIGDDAKDVAGGVIERDPATGKPNGILAETAGAPIRTLVDRTEAQLADASREFVRYFNSLGFTAFKEPMAFEEELRAYHAADARNELTLHMAAHIVHSSPLGDSLVPMDDMDRLRRTYASTNIRTDFAKLFLDGVVPGFTASFIEPYLAEGGYDVGSHDPDATLLIKPATLNQMLIDLDARGYTVKMHAVGSNAIRKGLDAIAAARAANGPSGLRHEVAHCNYVSDADLGRFAELGAVAEQSPKMWFPNPGTPIQTALLGADRVQKNHRIADLVHAKAEMTYASDWPAAAPDANPWSGLSGMLTRTNANPAYPGVLAPAQAITLAQALPLFTTNGARSLRMEADTGTLIAGRWADFVVLQTDLTQMPAPEIAAVLPQQTIWKGQIVHAA